uniref:Uncharacterized protein n=1 Tax=Quercus lobata TaxID=97700 RepID=A0A7N2M9J0_QUELO
MTSLKHLDLSTNNFNSSIPNWLYSLSHLEFLNLRKNLLQGIISTSIRNLTSAIGIDLTSNQLDGKVPRSLGNVCNLRELRLSDNKLSQEVSEILESLLRCVSYGLEVLEMYDAQLSSHLTEELGQFQNLTILSLEGNSIWGPIPISIGKLSSLRFLDLSSNQFNGTLPQSFGGLSKLEYVFIGGNMLEGVVSETHFANLRRLKELSTTPTHLTLKFNYLNLSHNHIYGEIPNIPVTLYPSSMIDMSSNSFNGSLPLISSNDLFVVVGVSMHFETANPERANLVIKGQVREYTTNLGLLRTIDLAKNNLSGEIPKEVTSLQGLQSLNLSFNNLTGRILENIGAMGSLESLDFSENQLSGEIPPSMSNLTFLSQLNLANNNLIGEIPLSTQLQSLNASGFIGNKLCGPPLTDNCTINNVKPNTKNEGSTDTGGREVDWFYQSLGLVPLAIVKANSSILSEKKLSKAFVPKGTQPGPWTKTTMKKPGFSSAKAEMFKLGSLTTVLSVKEVQSLASLALKARVAVVAGLLIFSNLYLHKFVSSEKLLMSTLKMLLFTLMPDVQFPIQTGLQHNPWLCSL